jgi:hypothetical protein
MGCAAVVAVWAALLRRLGVTNPPGTMSEKKKTRSLPRRTHGGFGDTTRVSHLSARQYVAAAAC